MKKLFAALLLAVSLVISSASHAEVFRLQFKDYIFGGFRTLDLQQALYKQHQVDASGLDIETIDVVIKSQYGGGLVWSGSRNSQVDRRVVTGQAVNFHNPADWTYSHIIFPVRGTAGDLQLNLNGLFKLREVLVRTRDFRDAENELIDVQDSFRIVLPMFHLKLSGYSSIDLKQLLANDTHVNSDGYQLKGIDVSVKSRQPGGQIWLETGRKVSVLQEVATAGHLFNSKDPGTYGHYSFTAVKSNISSMPWLLKFNGDIQLNEIIIKLAPR